ncbi:MAG TPA: D-sedoheptulose 7-phosphate isomerase [Candidatus Cloacimonadota bacterium]|nr:D-sedoheptulose 7-phosphate isomerase [Candidatus Cloacimonadota bacterium]HPT73097.1 D-sedoheptulose 7-phosphate isomerase [Candidatus Cloacimonadota bacterium]
MKKAIRKSFQDSMELLDRFIENEENIRIIEEISSLLAETFQRGGKVMIFGNGGSTCDAMHFAEEFTGRFRKERRPLPAIAIADSSHITCVGNDYGFDDIFSRGIEAYAGKNDMVIGISTSGNSANIIKAINKAKELGCITFGLLGKDGGKTASLCDYQIIVPGQTSDRIQEIHMTILHIIIETVERIMFPESYN